MLTIFCYTLLIVYLIGVACIKVSALFLYFLYPAKFVTGKETIKSLLVAWIWPLWILAGFCWADEMNEWVHKP